MDPTALLSLVSPLVAAVAAYLREEGATAAGGKAAEVIGERAGAAVADIGPRALATLRNWFRKEADAKAQQALTLVEQDPDDTDYQQKLVKETARLAAATSAFARELRVLAGRATVVQSGGVAIDNAAPNYGAQGVFHAPVRFDQRKL
jgi:hypothetical protein